MTSLLNWKKIVKMSYKSEKFTKKVIWKRNQVSKPYVTVPLPYVNYDKINVGKYEGDVSPSLLPLMYILKCTMWNSNNLVVTSGNYTRECSSVLICEINKGYDFVLQHNEITYVVSTFAGLPQLQNLFY